MEPEEDERRRRRRNTFRDAGAPYQGAASGAGIEPTWDIPESTGRHHPYKPRKFTPRAYRAVRSPLRWCSWKTTQGMVILRRAKTNRNRLLRDCGPTCPQTHAKKGFAGARA